MRDYCRAASVALAVCISAPCLAEDTTKWADVGAWSVDVDQTLGNGCFTYMVYDSGTVLRMGFDRLSDQVYLVVANRAWSNLEQGKQCDLKVTVGNAKSWSGAAPAIDFDGATAFRLDFTNVNFLLKVVRVRDLKIRYKVETLEHLDLSGGVEAFSEVMRCQEAMDAGQGKP